MAIPVLELRDVSKHYGSGESRVDALRHVSLAIHEGELVALLGPSGSGKSTLLSIAGALLRPSSGDLLLAGEPLAALGGAARTRLRLERIGFIFQGANLVSFLTGREQLLFIAELIGLPKAEAEQRADRLLDALGMARRANHYPEAMSGGERQRIAIARALMNDPCLILADEPTASLDSARGRQVVTMLREEVHDSDRAAILVTHDERLIDLCDRVVRIADGEIVDDAPAEERDTEHDPSLLDRLLHR